MAKDENKEQSKQTTEQALYAEYVTGLSPQALADKHGIDAAEVLAIIQEVQATNSRG